MVTNNEIKQVQRLHQKKYRVETGRFIVEGNKLMEELVRSDYAVEKIYSVTERGSSQTGISVEQVSPLQMKKMSVMTTPPGVLAIVEMPKTTLPGAFDGWVLALDGVSDPGNLGTILRIADWFGITALVLSSTSVDIFNPKVVQASMGSIFRIPVFSADLIGWMNSLPNGDRNIFVADMNGVSINEVEFPERGILVMGSESHGVSKEVTTIADVHIAIPGKGKAESLNVGVAAGIICSRLAI